MRLWHNQLIQTLPTQWLLGQHRECCAMRGNGWGRKHKTVDFVWKYGPVKLTVYHQCVRDELRWRGHSTEFNWFYALYRGKKCAPWNGDNLERDRTPYPEHDYDQCARDLMDLEHRVSNPDKWELLNRDDLKRLRQVGIYLPVSI